MVLNDNDKRFCNGIILYKERYYEQNYLQKNIMNDSICINVSGNIGKI